ncbi:MAG: GAF domain-containing sensor histidine kinase [Gemmataceae bacterium]|nr:GAF domain-containing sensor histidine kinase [Gemmata sp.]MDW8196975.1 GAF domain-containing sensor histidine kinase [Gemmataceae bacterium]
MNRSLVANRGLSASSATARELAQLHQATEILRSAVELIGRQTHPAGVADVVALSVARMTRADRVACGWVDEEAFQLQAVVENGRRLEGAECHPEELAVVARACRTQQPCVEGDRIAVPALDHHNRVTAVVMAVKTNGFRRTDVALVATAAHAATIALDRGRLFERLVDWNRSMEMLLAFNATINQHLAPPLLLRRLVEQAARLLEAEAGFAGLAVADGVGGWVMESDGYWSAGRWHDERRRWRCGEGTPGFVLATEFPYFSNNYPADPLADPHRHGVLRAMCVPIKNDRHQVLGFFELHRYQGGLFSWHDAAFLETLANMAAVAVENARLWRSLEESNRQLQAMSAANAQRLEDERRHIARELHDETGQALIAIKLSLQAVAGLVPAELSDLRAELDLLRQQVNDAAVRIRELSRQLRPPTLDHCGLSAALQQLADDFGRRTGIRVQLFADEPTRRFPPPVETAVYRIAQEALTNTAKHAAAQNVRLTLSHSARHLQLIITDDGCGFDPTAVTGGLGLLGMRERVDMLGGEFQVQSGPCGTTINVRLAISHGQPTEHHSDR